MARKKDGPNKSDQIRALLSKTPDMPVKDVIQILDGQGVKVTPNLVYFLKAKGKAKKRKKARQNAAAAIMTNGSASVDAFDLVRRIKGLATDVGGLRKLKSLVDILAE